MNIFYYVYVLYSKKDDNFYTGYTQQIRKRLKEHQSGQVSSTRHRIPLELVYWEGCLSQKERCTTKRKVLKNSLGEKIFKKSIKILSHGVIL